MNLPRFEYLRPTSVEQCLAMLKESGGEARILAGGTDLLVNMKYRVVTPKRVVSIRSIPELNSISEDGEGNVRIGACVGLSDLAANSLISKKLPALSEAIASVASWHIRNMASLGGNICLAPRCWYYNQSKLWRDARELCHRTGGNVCHAIKGSKRCHAVNSSDTAPMLAALDANVSISGSGGEKTIPIRDFYRDDGARHTVLGPGEMLTSVVIPKDAVGRPAIFIKIAPRKGIDFATGNIGAFLKGSELTLAINAIASHPLVLTKTAKAVMEGGFKDEIIAEAAGIARSELGVLTNLFTSAEYKRQIAEVLAKRALHQLKAWLRRKGGL